MEGFWKIDRERCLRCGACVSVCPVDVLELTEQGIFWMKERCTFCGICAKMCPVGSIEVKR